MSGASPSEHWLDRLAETRPTRRGFVRTVLAGAALTLPFARGFPARAAGCTKENPANNPWAWRWACLVSSDNQYASAQSNCNKFRTTGDAGIAAYVLLSPLSAISLAQVPLVKANYERARECLDRAVSDQASREQQVCLQRFQPGYSPCSPGGPCDTCSYYCCPCAQVSSGAICCLYEDCRCCPT